VVFRNVMRDLRTGLFFLFDELCHRLLLYLRVLRVLRVFVFFVFFVFFVGYIN